MRRLALVPTLIAVLLFPPTAAALGLGEIEMQSALNQQLDAEIPLRGVPAEQSDDIAVSLASEEAFQNVGLERPFALTRLEFAVEQRSDGSYYIHVTSSKAIVEPFLSFLVQVDWPGGNLLREYTVLLDPPVFTTEESGDAGSDGGTTAATTEDGGAGMPGEIEREAEAEAGTGDEAAASRSEADAQASAESATRAEPASGDADEYGEKPVFLQVEEREERAERAAAERAEAEAEARAQAEAGQAASTSGSSRGSTTPGQYGPVKQGDTLWSIASRLKSGDMTVQQMMLALLRYNPEAFGGDNINRLKQGYVLRVPNADQVRSISAQQALARVREQNSMWQQMQEGAGTDTTVAASEQATGQSAAPAPTGGSGEGAGELSIVGADEGGASSDESASATGNQEASTSEKLQLAREQLESTRMEKKELESRVKQLEDTVAKMEKLLTVRNERLTALQEELRKLEGRQQEAGASGEDKAGDDTAVAEADSAGEETGGAAGEAAGTGVGATTEGGTESDDETVAVAGSGTSGSGGTGDGSASGGNGTADDGSGTTETTTASADAAETAAGSGEADGTAAGAGEASDGTGGAYVPADKRASADDQGPVTTRTQPPEEIWLDKVNNFVAATGAMLAGVGGGVLAGPVGLGAAVALLLLIAGLLVLRRRRTEAMVEREEEFAPVDLDREVAPFDAGASGSFAAADERDAAGSPGSTDDSDDGESALMAEQFDVGSLDEDDTSDGPDSTAAEAAPGPLAGVDDEVEAEKDDTVAEADVYLAYGLHQQAEDLLRLALREHPGNATYQEKLLETLYASGKSDEFVEEAEQLRQQVDAPQSGVWQRVLAMGRDIAPRHELFAGGDATGTAADAQPAQPDAADLELDDADSEIDFGLDDEEQPSGQKAEQDEFASTMMLDSGRFGAVEGDAGLAGPDDAATAAAADASARNEDGEDEDLEFDLGDLEGLGGEQTQPPAAEAPAESPLAASSGTDDDLDFDLGEPDAESAAKPAQQAAAGADDDLDFDLGEPDAERAAEPAPQSPQEPTASADDDLDFDLDLDDNGSEAPAEAAPAAPAAAAGGSDEETLDFDFDLDADEAAGESAQAGSTTATPADEASGEGAAEGMDDALEIGDLELGDLDSLDDEDAAAAGGSETAGAPAASETDDADTFDLADLDTGEEGQAEAPAEERTRQATNEATGDDGADSFDLSDLDATGGDDTGESFNLDDLGPEESGSGTAAEQDAGSGEPEAAPAATPAATGAAEEAGPVDDGGGEDDEFDTMLDLARAYIDMGDPDSAANALEEVASAGNEKQRSEAESLLESVR